MVCSCACARVVCPCACAQAGLISGPFCVPFTYLATICADMPRMKGCASYNLLCANGTTVKMCKQYPALAG